MSRLIAARKEAVVFLDTSEQLQDALFYWLSFESFLLSERIPERLNRIQPWLLQFVDRCQI